MANTAKFRFYEELNDFLPPEKKKTWFLYQFEGNPAVKDAVESIGVPHTEVDLILVNSRSVTFSYHLRDQDVVSVYPVFESLDISNLTRLRPKPLREPRFILDTHLGKLARYLRMVGFDTLYENTFEDRQIIETAVTEKRTILTRDVELLKNKAVTHGYWVRSKNSLEQLHEVILRFDLSSSIRPFYRCILCNGVIKKVPKSSIQHTLPPKTRQYYDEFFQCASCEKVYWKGSHYLRMTKFIEDLRNEISQGTQVNREKDAGENFTPA